MKQEIATYCIGALATISSAQAIEGLKVQTTHFATNQAVLTLSTKASRDLSLIDWRLTRELDSLAQRWALAYFIQPTTQGDGLEIQMV